MSNKNQNPDGKNEKKSLHFKNKSHGHPDLFKKKGKTNNLLEQLKKKKLQEKQEKVKKYAQIEKKREERQQKRKERNSALCKLTAKGQPVMKHRINYLLKQIQETMGSSSKH